MRDILFKAKRSDNGEWVYGFYVRKYASKTEVDGKVTSESVHRIYKTINDKLVFYDIDECTLSQYTGLKDRRGNMIFEHDMVLVDRSERGESNITCKIRYKLGCFIVQGELYSRILAICNDPVLIIGGL